MPRFPESCASCSATGVPVSPGSAVMPADSATHEVVSANTLPFFWSMTSIVESQVLVSA